MATTEAFIRLRSGTSAAWTSANPTLLSGEKGIESDTLKEKVGDGVTSWNSLGYQIGKAVPENAVFTDTTYSIGDGGLTQKNFTTQRDNEVQANNAKVTNATHTGEVTGSGALTVDKTAITNKPTVTPVSGDFVLISDSSDSDNLKKANVNDFLGGGGGGGSMELIQTINVSSPVASVEFTGLSGYGRYIINFNSTVHSVASGYRMEVGNSGVYDIDPSYYDAATASAYFTLNGTTNYQRYQMEVILTGLSDTIDTKVRVEWSARTTSIVASNNALYHSKLTSYDSLKIYPASGTIDSGSISIYGIGA